MKPLDSIIDSAFVVKNDKMNLRIAILDINECLLHEETIPELVEQLRVTIRNDGCLNHPIIVDSESLLVLDGVHRIAALKKLRCKRIPACLVDYKNPSIKVLNWYRTIKGIGAIKRWLVKLKSIGLNMEKVNQIDENFLGVSPIVAALKTWNESYLVNSQFQDHKEAYDIIERIEKHLKTLGFEIKYETEEDAQWKLVQHQTEAVLLTPKLTKQLIIDTARSGKIFTHKTSRHIIPARPMRVCVPLDRLKSKESLSEINKELNVMLQKKHLTHIPPGSVFEGRRYEEDLYVFEENRMTVEVRIILLGVFRAFSNKGQVSVKLKNRTVRDVILLLAESLSAEAKRLLIDPELGDPRPSALILVNGKEINVLKGLETTLEDGDEVTLIPVSHGG